MPEAELGNEVGGDEVASPTVFDRDGWVVGRGVLPAEVVREVRGPVVAALLEQRLVEPDGEDRFRWVGDARATAAQVPGSGVAMVYREIDANAPLVAPGTARLAAQRLWGRPAALWVNTALFLKFPDRCTPPSDAHVAHRDCWQDEGAGRPDEHFNLWIPLTRFGMFEGSLAVCPDSHRDRPAAPPDAALGLQRKHLRGGAWRSTGFDVGDALLFRPDLLHAATANDSDDVRMAIAIRGQDARVALPPAAGMSADRTQPPGLIPECVLALLALRPSLTTWQVSVEFGPRGLVGRYVSLPPPGQLSHEEVLPQALRLLCARGLATVDSAGARPLYRATEAGLRTVDAWLRAPVDRLDQLVTVLPLKLELLDRLDPHGGPRDFTAQLGVLAGLGDHGSGPRAAWAAALVGAARDMLAAAAS